MKKCFEDKDNKLIIENIDTFTNIHKINNYSDINLHDEKLIVIPVTLHICITKSKILVDLIKYSKFIIDTLNSGFSGNIKNKYKSSKYDIDFFSKLLGSEKNGKIVYDYINYKFDAGIRFYLETIEYYDKDFITDFKDLDTELLVDNFYKQGFKIKDEHKLNLNIILLNFTCSTIGVSTFPWMNYVFKKINIDTMFVFLDYKSIHPDLSDTRYNNSRTLIHEVGHILGLRHIFSNNEETLLSYKIILGDSLFEKIFKNHNINLDLNTNIQDDNELLNFQLYPDIINQIKPTIKNPIETNKFAYTNNIPVNFACFMDYSPDEVLTHFTNSQILVMKAIIHIYKPYLIIKSSIYLDKFNSQSYYYLNLSPGIKLKSKEKFKIKKSELTNKYYRYKIVFKDSFDYKIKSKPKILNC